MESQPQNPEFIIPENFHPCNELIFTIACLLNWTYDLWRSVPDILVRSVLFVTIRLIYLHKNIHALCHLSKHCMNIV